MFDFDPSAVVNVKLAGTNYMQDWRDVVYRVGPNLYIEFKATAGGGFNYSRYKLNAWSGSGEMYSDIHDSVCVWTYKVGVYDYEDPQTGQILQRIEGRYCDDTSDIRLNWISLLSANLEANPINHGNILIPNGVTSIANYFLEAFVYRSLTIPNSVNRIGEFAFSSGTYVARWGYGTITLNISSINIPSSVTTIGKGAFRGWYKLKYIKFNNLNYLLPTYVTPEDNIFYMQLNYGDNPDDNGYQITEVQGGEQVLQIDWELYFNRTIGAIPQQAGYIYVFSQTKGKIRIPYYDTEQEIGFYDAALGGKKYIKLVEVTDPKASTIRIQTSKGIRAFRLE